MSYLTIRNLSQTFWDKVLFDHLDMTIVPGQRVALIARNGTGKTSLLNIIMGTMLYPEGTVELNRNIRTRILTQEHNLDPDKTIRDTLVTDDKILQMHELGIWDYEIQAQLILTELGLRNIKDQKVWLLSWWEAKRVSLAQVLIDQPDFLILDEPTNHLDVSMIEWLESYLTTGNKTVLLITHDRYFLEHVCTHIYELEHGQIRSYTGNYSYYIQNKAEREAIEQSTLHKMKQVYKQELEWIRRAPQGRQTKSNYRTWQFDIVVDNLSNQKKRVAHINNTLELWTSHHSRLGWLVLKVKNLTKSFESKMIVDRFSHEFHAGERVGIIGANGVGKSSLIKLLLEQIPADSGSIVWWNTISVWHYEQQIPAWNPTQTVLWLIQEMGNQIRWWNTTMSASLLLEQFMFSPKHQRTLLGSLSGWEKRRLALLMVLIQQPNFLILDEPTNDFDIMTINILEQFLMSYSGCLVIISHDRYFMDKLVDHLFVMEGDGKITDFWGSYTDWHNQHILWWPKKATETTTTVAPTVKASWNKHHYTMNEYMKQITKLTTQKDKLLLQLDEVWLDYVDYTRVGSQINELTSKINELEEKWFELAEM